MRTCTYSYCLSKHYSKGFCATHYQRMRKTGSPSLGGWPTRLERMERQVCFEPMSGCWLWEGRENLLGYGISSWGLAHRVMYALHGGELDPSLVIDHVCRVTQCVNPSHLEQVTQKENVRRGDIAAFNRRRAAGITHCPQGHEYSPENTRLNKSGARNCRACQRARLRAYRMRRKAAGAVGQQ